MAIRKKHTRTARATAAKQLGTESASFSIHKQQEPGPVVARHSQRADLLATSFLESGQQETLDPVFTLGCIEDPRPSCAILWHCTRTNSSQHSAESQTPTTVNACGLRNAMQVSVVFVTEQIFKPEKPRGGGCWCIDAGSAPTGGTTKTASSVVRNRPQQPC